MDELPATRRGASAGGCRARPGELIHIDVKKLGGIRGAKTVVPFAVDDATRLAYVEVLGDEKASTAVGFLRRATHSGSQARAARAG